MGYAVLEIKGTELEALDIGVVYLNQFPDHSQRLQRIFERLHTIIGQYQPEAMAIEAPFFGKNVQSMLKLGRAQGVAMAAAMTKGLTVTEYSPKKIKQAITGNGNAAKEQVAAMLSNILKVELEGQYLDATDALATALCHYFQTSRGIPQTAPKPARKAKGKGKWGNFLQDNPDRILPAP